MGRRNNIFKLLGSENVNSNKVALSVTMLASLGGGNFNNLSQQTINDIHQFMKPQL